MHGQTRTFYLTLTVRNFPNNTTIIPMKTSFLIEHLTQYHLGNSLLNLIIQDTTTIEVRFLIDYRYPVYEQLDNYDEVSVDIKVEMAGAKSKV